MPDTDAFHSSTESDKIIPAFVQALNLMDDIPRTERVTAGPMRYSFAPLNIVLDAVRPHLRANGLAITQVPTTDQGVKTVVWHESGQWIEFDPLLILPAGGTPQNVGSAITYARRYSLLSILGLATEDDDGAAAAVSAGAHTPPVEDPVAGRVDTLLHRLTALTDAQKGEMRAWADKEDRKLSGKALYDSPDWLDQVEAYLDVMVTDEPSVTPAEPDPEPETEN